MPAPKDPVKYVEYCKRISEGHKLRSKESYQKPTLKGKPRSEETKSKISEGQLGKKRPDYINRLSPEIRLKLSLANKKPSVKAVLACNTRLDKICHRLSAACRMRSGGPDPVDVMFGYRFLSSRARQRVLLIGFSPPALARSPVF